LRTRSLAALGAAAVLTLSACAGDPEELVFTLTPSQEAGGLIESAEPLAALLEAELGIPVSALPTPSSKKRGSEASTPST
jgi:ABC-type phosphate/phosphonate transport system substrate-binding protein